jgi:GDP-L-fucose synthase
MNVLITGTSNFLAKEFKQYFVSKGHSVWCISRSKPYCVDLTDKESTRAFFIDKKFDIVLHTSIVGSLKQERNNSNVLIDNILMFNNLLNNKQHYKILFNFCSGAALTEDEYIGCSRREEEYVFHCIPKNNYGLSKNIIARQIKECENVYNLRLFGCFGKHENNDRFIKNSILKIKNNLSPIIHKDKEMDFIFIEDVCKTVEYITENNTNFIEKDINLVYSKKCNLTDIMDIIMHLTNSKRTYTLDNKELDVPYSGDSIKLENLDLKLSGLYNGINEVIKYVF